MPKKGIEIVKSKRRVEGEERPHKIKKSRKWSRKHKIRDGESGTRRGNELEA